MFALPFTFFYAKNVQDSEEQDLFRSGEGDTPGVPEDDFEDGTNPIAKFAMKGFDSSSEEDEDGDG